MRRFSEFLYLLWVCKFCDHLNRVSLRKRSNEAFPGQDAYDNFKPYACHHCGEHEHFEFREAHIIERVIEANGDR
jgi:RNase P subunit RPR2